MTAVIGPGAAKLVALAILISIFSAANGSRDRAASTMRWPATDSSFIDWPRCIRALSYAGFRRAGGSAWVAALAVTGTFEQLFTYVVFSGWIFMP